jgi:hypothetical protein
MKEQWGVEVEPKGKKMLQGCRKVVIWREKKDV